MKRFFGSLAVVEPWDASEDPERRVEVLGRPIGTPTQLILLLAPIKLIRGSAVDGHMRGVRRANMLVSGLLVF
jgi:hypothetical protein